MTNSNSTEYYISREHRERELAEAATNPAIANIHLEMAARYSELITNRFRECDRNSISAAGRNSIDRF